MYNFDKAAATAVDKRVLEKVLPYFTEYYGNPSANHFFGKQCKNKIEETRKIVADYINGEIENVYFTHSSSQSNTTAIVSALENGMKVIPSVIEHVDILDCINVKGNSTQTLSVDKNGIIDIDELMNMCKKHSNALFCILLVNNETGVIQPIQEISNIIHESGNYLMVDCTQAITHVKIDIKADKIDVLSFGSHKINGFKGAAVLYSTLPLKQQVFGHQPVIGGTEDTPAIIGLGEALKLERNNEYIKNLRDDFENQVLSSISDCYVVCGTPKRAPHISNICFKGCDAQTLQAMLDIDEIYVGVGSSCSSYELTASHVLQAIGMTKPDIYSCVRFSFDAFNTKEEIDQVVHVLQDRVSMIRKVAEESLNE